MCGRVVLSHPVEYYSQFLHLTPTFATQSYTPSFNLPPSKPLLIARLEEGIPILDLAKWGLLPFWVKTPQDFSAKTFNARIETADQKASFKHSAKRRRCLIPIDGYYEWSTLEGSVKRRPFFFSRRDEAPLVLAGLWDTWHSPDGSGLISCSILTGPATKDTSRYHDRMPLSLESSLFEEWLACKEPLPTLQKSKDVCKEGTIISHPVSTRVGNVANDDASLLEEIARGN